MNTAISPSRARDSHWALIIVLTVLAAGLLWFLSDKTHYFTHYSSASYTDYYWPRRAGLLPHLLGGSLAIVSGLVQIWLGLTGRVSTLHRTLGKVYAIGVLIGSMGGIYMALTIPPGYRPYATGLIGLDVAWIVTTSMALYAIHLRNIEQHRDWMLRSYTVTFAFVTSGAYRSAASDRRGETLLPLRNHSNADNDDQSSHGMRNGRSPTRNRYTPEASDSPLSTGRGRDGRIDAGARLENHVYRQA